MWKKKWASVHRTDPKAVPTTAIEALRQCSVDVYSIVHRLLKVLATLPVSNATPERSHSTLRRLKTWLVTAMDEKRLTGLALINVHLDIDIDVKSLTGLQRAKSAGCHCICNFTSVFLNVLFFVPEKEVVCAKLLFYLSLPSRCSLIP